MAPIVESRNRGSIKSFRKVLQLLQTLTAAGDFYGVAVVFGGRTVSGANSDRNAIGEAVTGWGPPNGTARDAIG